LMHFERQYKIDFAEDRICTCFQCYTAAHRMTFIFFYWNNCMFVNESIENVDTLNRPIYLSNRKFLREIRLVFGTRRAIRRSFSLSRPRVQQYRFIY